MAKGLKPKKSQKSHVIEKKAEIKIIEPKKIEKKQEIDPEEFEEFMEDDSPVFNSFIRKSPSIRIQPVAAQLEIELSDIPKKEEENNNHDQYKPAPEKNYSPGQKYELPGGTSYSNITPKEVFGSSSISAASNPFIQQSGVKPESGGYPGEQARNYQSGLEEEAEKKQREKRRW